MISRNLLKNLKKSHEISRDLTRSHETKISRNLTISHIVRTPRNTPHARSYTAWVWRSNPGVLQSAHAQKDTLTPMHISVMCKHESLVRRGRWSGQL